MKKKLLTGLSAAFLASMTFSSLVQAANETVMVSYQAVLDSAEGKSLNNAVKLSFGPNSVPSGATQVNTVTINKIAKGHGRHDFNGACNAAVLEALKDLQAQAIAQGANGVANIVSSYKGTDTLTSSVAECHAGGTGGHLTLKGTLVKI
jgi:uncharacterized protein YbjQ (UPF0145 family)